MINEKEKVSLRILSLVLKRKLTVWDSETATTCSRDSGVGFTLRRETMARGIWSRWKMSPGLLLVCTKPQTSSEAADSICCFMMLFWVGLKGKELFILQISTRVKLFVFCVYVYVDAVCAPEAQKDCLPTLQTQDPCTAPISASTAATQKVITQTGAKVLLCLCFDCFISFSTMTW